MKKIVITAGVIAAVALLIILMLITGGPSYQKSNVVIENVHFPYLNNQEILFFTGKSFAKYNSKNNSATTLTPTYIFPEILEVKWSPAGALFDASSYTPADSFSKILDKNQVSSDKSYWWLANFKTGSITLVADPANPQARTSVVWHSSGTNFISVVDKPGDDYEAAIYSNPLNGPAIKLLQHNKSYIHNPVWADNKSLVFESLNSKSSSYSLIRLDLKTGLETVLAHNIITGTVVSQDGKYATFYKFHPVKKGEQTEVPLKDIYLLEVASKKDRLIVKDFGGSSNWSKKEHKFLLSGTSGKKNIIVAIEADLQGKMASFKPANEEGAMETSSAYLLSSEPIFIWATDLKHNLYKFSTKKDTSIRKVLLEPKYEGFEELKEYGLSRFQSPSLNHALSQYFSSNNTKVQTARLDPESINHLPRNKNSLDPTEVILFNIKTESSHTYKAKIEYPNISSLRLYLYTPNDQLLYDSGLIDLTLLEVK